MENASNVQFADGRLLFVRGNSLMAQPFDPATLALSQDPVTLADAVLANVVIIRGSAFGVAGRRARLLAADWRGWLPRVDRARGPANPHRRQHADEPDARPFTGWHPRGRIPMGMDGLVDLWLVDFRRAGVRSRVTHDAQPTMAAWSHDGRTLYYSARAGGSALNIYRRRESGRGPEELVFEDAADKSITSVSRGTNVRSCTKRSGPASHGTCLS